MSFLTSYRFRVLFTVLWFILGAILTLFVLFFLFAGGNIQSLQQQVHLRVFIEFVSAGLVPILFVIGSQEDLSRYGFSKERIVSSLLLSTIFVVAMLLYNYLRSSLSGQGTFLSYEIPGYSLGFPDKIIYPMLGIVVYGPLEVFFVLFILVNMEKWFQEDTERHLTKSLFVTALIIGLLHIVTTRSLETAITTGIIFFVLGLIFKYTGNCYGPMLAWTLINNYNWYLVQWLFL